MLQSSRERLLVFGGAAVILILLGAIFFRGTPYVEVDPELIKIEKLERHKDVSGLIQAAHDPNPRVAARALAALSRVGGDAAEPAFQDSLSDSRPAVRQAALLAIGDGGRHALVGAVVQTLKTDKSAVVRVGAAQALGQLGDWDGVEALVVTLDDTDRFVRQAAGRAIERILGFRVGYNADASPASRQAAIAQIRARLPAAHGQYEMFKNHWSNTRPS
jgi:HEAT repeat protein